MVSPANSLPQMCIPTTRRAVVNREPVGMDLGLRFGDGRDSFVGGDCDEAFLELSARLGWLEELRESRACRCRAPFLDADRSPLACAGAVRDELPEESQRRLDARST